MMAADLMVSKYSFSPQLHRPIAPDGIDEVAVDEWVFMENSSLKSSSKRFKSVD